MSWVDELRSASFRGVAFHVTEVEGEFGRRTVTHEFPGRDSAQVEDLGRRVRRDRVEAFVIGPGYAAARDRLRAALEQRGPGRLMHPFWGELTVSVEGTSKVVESTRDGGWARFTFTVVQATAAKSPVRVEDTSSRAQERLGLQRLALTPDATTRPLPVASALVEASAAEISVEGLSDGQLSDVEATLGRIVDGVRSARRKVASALAIDDESRTTLARFSADIADLIRTPEALAADAVALLGAVTAPIVALRTLANLGTGATEEADAINVERAGDVASSLNRSAGAAPLLATQLVEILRTIAGEFASLGQGEPPSTDAVVIAQRTALSFLFRCAGAIAVCDAAVQLPYETSDQATALREELVEHLDTLILDAMDDAVSAALADALAAVVEHLARAALELPRLSSYTPPQTLPALVIAHSLYGDARRDEEIVRRNRVRNPGFVPGGVELEVLSDA